jgi:transcriptional regulator with XRE-family HTH domain
MDLGSRIRELRKGRGLSLRELAHQSGYAPSFISKVERNRTSPSIASLQKICKILRTPFSEVLRESTPGGNFLVVPFEVDAHAPAMFWHRAHLRHLLPLQVARDFTSLILTLEVGGEIPLRSSRRSINQLTLLLSGKVEANVNGQVFELEKKKVVYFDIALKHGWKNIGNERAEILMVHPYHFELFEQEDEDFFWTLRERRHGRTLPSLGPAQDASPS